MSKEHEPTNQIPANETSANPVQQPKRTISKNGQSDSASDTPKSAKKRTYAAKTHRTTPSKGGRPKGGKNQHWTLAEEARLAQLYTVTGVSAKEIGKLLERTDKSVESKIESLGLSSPRRHLKIQTQAEILARVREQVPELAKEVFEEGRELLQGGIKLAKTAITEGDSKGYNHATAGVARMSQMVVQAARNFEGNGSNSSEPGSNFNLFYFAGNVEKVVKTVKPIENEVENEQSQ